MPFIPSNLGRFTHNIATRFENKVEEIRDSLIVNPAFKPSDLPAYWDALWHANSIGLDDRQLLLEKVLVLMSKLKNQELSLKIQHSVIKLLYNDLPHPPSGYLCLPTVGGQAEAPTRTPKYIFRSADGSNYSNSLPTLGKAGSPYARSVPSSNTTPLASLPDAGLVFDTLLRRDKEQFTPHPGGVSSLFFAFADLVIHSIFNTNHRDGNINDSSSYLDLSVLYGNNEAQVDSVRRKDGTGRLWPDVFADGRLLFMPPASCAVLVLLNRNHNYIAERILDINERGTYTNPPLQSETCLEQDEEIFQRARLVNCGYFLQIILGDYVGAILGLVIDGSDWRLDPLMTIREKDHKLIPRGEGNAVSIEFNLLYRWHATLSAEDDKWITDKFAQTFQKDPSKLTSEEFKAAACEYMRPPKDVRHWTFDNLKREPDGHFKDDDLANIIQNATEQRAGAFQARGIPEAMRIIEIMGIEQARKWGTCSMNEFRKFLGLQPYKSFEEWNPNPEIHTAAAALYRDIDRLELHVGLQAEETKVPGPGAGLCPGYTISRAILADAVCLTRGDRYFTIEHTPSNLTSWGYQDCRRDTNDGSYGGLLTKLLYRTLPDHYPTSSAYAHFPFLDPVYMKDHLKKTNADLVDKYVWTRPRQMPATMIIENYIGVKQIMTEPNFCSVYDDNLLNVIRPALIQHIDQAAMDTEEKRYHAFAATKRSLNNWRSNVTKALLCAPDTNPATYFKRKLNSLLQEKASRQAAHNQTKYVDIVKDVINLLPIHWICEEVVGLPLKTTSNKHGTWNEQDVYTKFANIAHYVYLNFDPADDWKLKESSQRTCKEVIDFIEAHLEEVKTKLSISDICNHHSIDNYHCHDVLKNLLASDKEMTSKTLAVRLFAAIIPSAALYSHALAKIVNFYLKEDNSEALAELQKLLLSRENDTKVMAYAWEALRLDPPIAGVYRTAMTNIPIGPITIEAGQHVLASIGAANLDPYVFGIHNNRVDINRSHDSGIVAIGEHGLLTPEFFNATVPVILDSILNLNNIERAPGRSGTLNSFKEQWRGITRMQYIDTRGNVTPWSDSLIIKFT